MNVFDENYYWKLLYGCQVCGFVEGIGINIIVLGYVECDLFGVVQLQGVGVFDS